MTELRYDDLPDLHPPIDRTDHIGEPLQPVTLPSITFTKVIHRRSALRALVLGTAMGAGIHFLDLFGGAAPAEAAPPAGGTCSTAGLTYRTDACVPASYSTTCTKGCFRDPSVASTSFCLSSTYNSRHKTCGETVATPGGFRDHAIRPNKCGGSFDGWNWERVDSGSTCGCTNYPQFACNDGFGRYISGGVPGSWFESICQTRRCR